MTGYPGEVDSHYACALKATVKLILSLPDHALPVGLRTQYHLLHENARRLCQTLCHSETFARDIAAIKQQYGLSCNRPLSDETERTDMLIPLTDYRSLYTPELIDSVARRYRKDIDAFGYHNAADALRQYAERRHLKSRAPRQTTPAKSQDAPAKTPSKAQQRRAIISYCVGNLGCFLRAMLWFSCATEQRPLGPRYVVTSEEYPGLFYVVNHKCASTSIRTIMRGHVAHPDAREPARAAFSRAYRRMRRSFLMRLFEKPPSLNAAITRMARETPMPLRFGFVRDPFHRLVSCYRDKALKLREEDKLWNLPKYEKALVSVPLYDLLRYQKWPDSFADFVGLVASTPDHLADAHFRSQYASLHENGELLVDHIGKVENFAEDMRRIGEQFGLTMPETNAADRSTGKYDYRDYYTPELVEIAAQRYRQDIETFGYQQALAELRRHVAARNA